MRKQCVPGSFFSAHALEPGNEATTKCEQCEKDGKRTLKEFEEVRRGYGGFSNGLRVSLLRWPLLISSISPR